MTVYVDDKKSEPICIRNYNTLAEVIKDVGNKISKADRMQPNAWLQNNTRLKDDDFTRFICSTPDSRVLHLKMTPSVIRTHIQFQKLPRAAIRMNKQIF